MGQENDQVKQRSEQYMHDLMERLKQRRNDFYAAHKHKIEGNQKPEAKEHRQECPEPVLRQMMMALREERCA